MELQSEMLHSCHTGKIRFHFCSFCFEHKHTWIMVCADTIVCFWYLKKQKKQQYVAEYQAVFLLYRVSSWIQQYVNTLGLMSVLQQTQHLWLQVNLPPDHRCYIFGLTSEAALGCVSVTHPWTVLIGTVSLSQLWSVLYNTWLNWLNNSDKSTDKSSFVVTASSCLIGFCSVGILLKVPFSIIHILDFHFQFLTLLNLSYALLSTHTQSFKMSQLLPLFQWLTSELLFFCQKFTLSLSGSPEPQVIILIIHGWKPVNDEPSKSPWIILLLP